MKAFVGMILELKAGDPKVFLIDEPEAFLHPALSNKLGRELARASANSNKQLFASTHSPNFLMGCIQSGAAINIVRLTYRNGVATARLLKHDDIVRLMRNPLLRSTGALTGLFYEFVVITEGDADRAFYQEINERLGLFDPGRHVSNCLFINGQNKQTIHHIMKPLRELGIPTTGIVDIDMLKEGGQVWDSLLSGAFIPEIDKRGLAGMRAAVLKCFEASGKDMKRDGGVEVLSGEERESVENLIARLAEYGLFVVKGGELESWLKDLGAAGHGPKWLVSVFEKMGEDPDTSSYLKPTEGDVWDFMGQVRQWVLNKDRRGIPT